MSVLEQVLMAVLGMAQATNPYATITIGALPADDGICMAPASAAPDTTFFSKGMAYQRSIVLNGKHSDQNMVSSALSDIHLALTQAKKYPNEEKFQITNIETISAPSYLSREQNNQWLYGSSLRVRFYLRKD